MWTPLLLPQWELPIAGFTFPVEDAMFVIDASGIFALRLAPVVAAQLIADSARRTEFFSESTGHIEWNGRREFVFGDDSGDVTYCDLPSGDRLVLAPGGDAMWITDPTERDVRQSIAHSPVAEVAWLYAGFALDGRWLVIGNPRELLVFGKSR